MAITTKHQLLAWDLVEGLGDEAHKGVYFRLAKNYNEAFIREILSVVKIAYNEGKIKSGDRGRYFMGILKKEITKHGKNIRNNTRGRSSVKKKGIDRRRSKKSGN